MIAVLTGRIIHARKSESSASWIEPLKELLLPYGNCPRDWDAYREDNFQFKTSPEESLRWALKIDSCMRMNKGMGARIGIGLGYEDQEADSILDSQGSAYVHSAHAFKQLAKTNCSLFFQSEWTELNDCLNSGAELLTALVGQWSSNQARLALTLLQKPNHSQEEIARLFHISQSAVSQRKKRAHLDAVEHYLQYTQRIIRQQVQEAALAL